MTSFIKISTLTLGLLFISTNENLQAQKRVKTTKKVIIKNRGKKVASRTVVYKRPTKKVVSVRTLPNKTVITHKGRNYYYANRKFYTYNGGRYITILPRIGFRISVLPRGFVTIRHLNQVYFWLDGIYYQSVDDAYQVVKPELGTVIYELPDDYERVEIDGNTYYEFNNILYEKIQVDGTRAYEVVGFINE